MDRDDHFMRQALLEARRAAKNGEVPVGAVAVRGDTVIARGHNASIGKNDPTGHAEIEAIRGACAVCGNYRIPDIDLYVTLEPCAMCVGAAVVARIRRLVFGARDPKAGALVSAISGAITDGSAFPRSTPIPAHIRGKVFTGIVMTPASASA